MVIERFCSYGELDYLYVIADSGKEGGLGPCDNFFVQMIH